MAHPAPPSLSTPPSPPATASISPTDANTDKPAPRRVVQKRSRQQLSCTACHSRKQACDRQTPCSRCIKRGMADSCQVEGKSSSSSRALQGISPGSSADQGPNVQALLKRIATLEGQLREAKGSPDNPTAAEGSDVEVAAEALAALGELAKSKEAGDSSAGFSNWQGTSSVSSFINGASCAGGSTPAVLGTRAAPEVVANLVSVFPSRALATFLVDHFYSPQVQSLLKRFVITRRSTFDRLFEATMAWKDDIDLLGFVPPPPCSAAALSMICIALATALQFLSDEAIPFVQQHFTSHVQLQDELKMQAKLALDLSEAQEPPSLVRIEATLWQALYLKNAGRPNSNLFLIAQAIRSAQQMGMHREGAEQWGLKPYEAEQRRRLWWSLYCYDKQANFAFGRPYIIHDAHVDVREPANADTSLIDEDGTDDIVSLPVDMPTPFTAAILEIRVARFVSMVFDRLFSCRPFRYSDVLDVDRKLSELEASMPESFRSPSAEVIHKAPYIVADSAAMSLQLVWIRCLLHRQYLLKTIPAEPALDYFAPSRQLAIALSQQIIVAARDSSLVLTRAQNRFFLFPFRIFDAAANLALAILQSPSSSPSLVADNDRWILEARTALVAMGEDNVVANEGVRCIDALRKKIADSLPEGSELVAPVVDVGPGPHPIPYQGGLISFDEPVDGAGATTEEAPRPTTGSPTLQVPGVAATAARSGHRYSDEQFVFTKSPVPWILPNEHKLDGVGRGGAPFPAPRWAKRRRPQEEWEQERSHPRPRTGCTGSLIGVAGRWTLRP